MTLAHSRFTRSGYIYKEAGIKGLYRGVTPRICLGIWQSVTMIYGADVVKEWLTSRDAAKAI